MNEEVKYCPSCGETGLDIEISKKEHSNPFWQKHPFGQGFMFGEKAQRDDCPYCGGQLIPSIISEKDYDTIADVSDCNRQLLEAMIALKEKDIIEYELKMGQFRNQVQQKKAQEKQELQPQPNVPKCPTCQSTNIEKISLTSKAIGGAMFGLFSSNVRKTMRCKNCKYKW